MLLPRLKCVMQLFFGNTIDITLHMQGNTIIVSSFFELITSIVFSAFVQLKSANRVTSYVEKKVQQQMENIT